MPDDRFFHKRACHSERVNLLTDLEFRVWWQYVMSADDFGVMRASAVTLQADNDHLGNRPAKVLVRCIDALVTADLIREFEHQKRRYVYQHDWQTYQKVSYPRATNHPMPPTDLLAKCDEPTQKLFLMHPGGAGRKRDNGSANVPKTDQEPSPLMRAGAYAKRLTANGLRLTANGSEGGAGETDAPLGLWLTQLRQTYPPKALSSGYATESAFAAAVLSRGTPSVTFGVMMLNLDSQKRGSQWLSGKVPRLDRWLSLGLWEQHHDGPAVTDATAGTLAAAAALMREGA